MTYSSVQVVEAEELEDLLLDELFEDEVVLGVTGEIGLLELLVTEVDEDEVVEGLDEVLDVFETEEEDVSQLLVVEEP